MDGPNALIMKAITKGVYFNKKVYWDDVCPIFYLSILQVFCQSYKLFCKIVILPKREMNKFIVPQQCIWFCKKNVWFSRGWQCLFIHKKKSRFVCFFPKNCSNFGVLFLIMAGLELARVPRVPGTRQDSEHHLWHPLILRFLILTGTPRAHSM